MIFQLKAASLPKGTKKQLNCIFIIASQNEQSRAVVDTNTLQILPESVKNALSTAMDAEHFTAASGQQISLIDSTSQSQYIILGTGKTSAKCVKTAAQAITTYCQQYEVKQAYVYLDNHFDAENAINAFVLCAADTASRSAGYWSWPFQRSVVYQAMWLMPAVSYSSS